MSEALILLAPGFSFMSVAVAAVIAVLAGGVARFVIWPLIRQRRRDG